MAYTGDGQALLRGSRGEQCAGSAEEDPFQLPGVQLIQQCGTQGDCAASAAGAAGMHILPFCVKDHGSAIHEFSTKR